MQQPAREDVEVPHDRLEADDRLREALLAPDQEGDIAGPAGADIALA